MKKIPKFVLEGYAMYQEESYLKIDDVVLEPQGMDFIGVKENAPKWAKEEYKEWIESKEKAEEQGINEI